MGQPITVFRKPSSRSDLVRFEINRTLSGTGHERYGVGGTISGDRPTDELARRLIAAGGVRGVHIHSNMITVQLEPGAKADGFEDIIRELYLHYKPGVEVSFTG